MERITQRQQPALSELYLRYSQPLRGLIGSVVHEESEADDVLQESFLQIWREAFRYSPKLGRPLSWVVTIARRRAIDYTRRRYSYRQAKGRFAEEAKAGTASAAASQTESELARADLRRFLNLQLQTLPPGQREVVELTYFEGLSQREIARAMKTPLGTVKTRIELGMRKLTQSVRPLRHKI